MKRNRKKSKQALVASFHEGCDWSTGEDSDKDSTGWESDEDFIDAAPGGVYIEGVTLEDYTGG